MKESDVFHTVNRFRNLSCSLIINGAIIGVLSGLVAIAYRFLLGLSESWIVSFHDLISLGWPWLIFILLFMVFLAFVIAKIISAGPYASGSGIPQIEGEMIGLVDESWFKTLLLKFAGGCLATCGGLSLGREGPSIQLGALTAKGYARLRHFILSEERLLMTCGAAAGLSAAFNAPLAGVLFALEEIHRNFSIPVVLSVMVAAIAGNYLSQTVFGLAPVFNFAIDGNLSLDLYWTVFILAVITGAAGVFYNRMTISFQDLFKRYVPSSFLRLILAFAFSAVFLIFGPIVLCGGHLMIEVLYQEPYSGLAFLLVLLSLKFFFSLISFCSGAPGGIFFPLLVMGAYIGAIYAVVLNRYCGIPLIYLNNYIVLAMVGFFVAIVRSPITGIILISEMTGSLSQLTALILVAVMAYFIAEKFKSEPIYESLLKRILNNDMSNLTTRDNEKYLQEMPVEIDSVIADRMIKDIAWPKNFLLIAVKRSGREFIPDGNLTILSGDVLVFICDDDASSYVVYMMSKLTKSQRKEK